MTWTDARIAQLARLWTEGVSAAGIAEALGDVSRSAVLGKLHRLKLLGSRKPASQPQRYRGAPIAPPAPPAVRRLLTSPQPFQSQAAAPPDPPRSPWREAAFAPLAGTAPRSWLSRDFGECAFPVGGQGDALLSCCAPVRPRSAYCTRHHAVVFRRARPIAPPAQPPAATAPESRWAA
jgi:GcrA cell cycle regulator